MCDGAWRRCHSGEEQGGGGPTLNSKPDITHSNIGLVTQYVFRKRQHLPLHTTARIQHVTAMLIKKQKHLIWAETCYLITSMRDLRVIKLCKRTTVKPISILKHFYFLPRASLKPGSLNFPSHFDTLDLKLIQSCNQPGKKYFPYHSRKS